MDIVENILKKIKKIVELPEEGLLTGQSLSTLYLEEIKWNKYKEKKEIKINDIDVFKINILNSYEFEEKRKETSIYTKKGNQYLTYDGYQSFFDIYKEKYLVLESKEIEKLNITEIAIKKLDNIKILESFDFNCVQIGIDLETKKLIKTKEFEMFEKTGELKIVNYHTPIISSLRGIKKSKEQGYYFDKEKSLDKMMFIAGLKTFNLITEKTKNKYKEEIEELKIKTEIFKFENLEKEFYLREEKQNTNLFEIKEKRYEKEIEIYKKIFLLKYHKESLDWYYENMRNKEKIEFLLKSIKIKEPKRKEYGFYYISGEVGNEKREYNNKKGALRYLIQMHFREKNFSINKIKEIVNFIEEDTYVYLTIFLSKKYEELLLIYEKIKRVYKKYGRLCNKFYYDALEYRYEEGMKKDEIIYLLDKTEEDIKEKEKNLLKEVYKEKREIESFNIKEWTFTELINGKELYEEGKSMHHCVAGYGESIQNNISIIIRIENKKDKNLNMTCELQNIKYVSLSKDNYLYEKQLKDIKSIYQLMHKFNIPAEKELHDFVENALKRKIKLGSIKEEKEKLQKEIDYSTDIKYLEKREIKKIELKKDIPF